MGKTLDDFKDELETLEKAAKLLEKIWEWYGPYGPPVSRAHLINYGEMKMPKELHTELMKFFKFNDEE